MNREAIFHSMDSEYSHAVDKNTVIIRLRSGKGDLAKCVVCYGDRVYPREFVKVESMEMQIVASDSLFDYYEAVIQASLTRICYYFILSDGKLSTYYYGYEFHDKLGNERNQYFQLPYIREEDIALVPEWAKKAIIYQIFPDSFASSKASITKTPSCIKVDTGTGSLSALADHGNTEVDTGTGSLSALADHGDAESGQEDSSVRRDGSIAEDLSTLYCRGKLGGNLRGIIENIPYLQDLGINCIYLTPIFTAGAYHKYDTIDYLSVDPCFGDLQTLKQLVSECHASGIRVLLDGVFNHCGAGFFAFRDVMEKGEQSVYKDWFFIRDYPVNYENPNYECFAYVRNMPKLNTGNREVIDYFINVGTYWIKEAGIDGWRLDVANEVDHNFWREFRKALRAVNPEVFLLGEIWYDAREWLMGDQFDSVMNYNFMYACKDFFARRIINVKQFDERFNYLKMRYKKNIQYAQMNLLDSHDVPRFLSQAGEDIRRQKVAALFMLMQVGVPNIYYGDEKGLTGMTENDYRKPMLWEDSEESKAMLDFYKKLISIRKEYMDLMLGNCVTRDTDLAANIYVFTREEGNKKLFIVINNSESHVQYRLQVGIDAGVNTNFATELISGKKLIIDKFSIILELEPISGMILKIQ